MKGAADSGRGTAYFAEEAWQQTIEPIGAVPSGQVPKKSLGRTGVQVSAMGLGGYHLGSAETDQAANEIVAKALDHGVTFFDNAWEYHDGLSEERLGKALKGKRQTSFRDDQSLHPRAGQKGRHANAGGIAAPACKPIISISGRFTKWFTKMILI